VPRQAPATVPTASARSAPFAFGSLPFSSSRSPFDATPIRVPTVSKISTNRNEKKTVKNWKLKILLKSKNFGEDLSS